MCISYYSPPVTRNTFPSSEGMSRSGSQLWPNSPSNIVAIGGTEFL